MRLRQQTETALLLGEALEGHPQVTEVRHPGLPSHPQFDLAKRQLHVRGHHDLAACGHVGLVAALTRAWGEPFDPAECAEIAVRHIGLAKPKRLLLFGDGPCKALLGEPLTRARGRVHRIEGIRAVATFHPRWLLQRPSDKALAWRDLLLLMSEND